MAKDAHTDNPFRELAKWYARHCNGDWEHYAGITIHTLDNPGWGIDINLEDTELQGKPFERIQLERSRDDWLVASVEGTIFNLRCGPLNVEEALTTFLNWANS